MALIKAILTGYDVEATYWHIGEEHKDFRAGTNKVVLFGYSTTVARIKKADPLGAAVVMIVGDDFKPNMTRNEIYVHIKSKSPQFADSVDD